MSGRLFRENIVSISKFKKIELLGKENLILFFVFFSLCISAYIFVNEWFTIVGYDYQFFYKPVADRIFNGESYIEAISCSKFNPSDFIGCNSDGVVTQWPPGFSYFLVIILAISSFLSVDYIDTLYIVIFAIHSLTALMLFHFYRGYLSKKMNLLGVLIWFLYPPNIFLIKQPNTETIFIALFLIACLTIKRMKLTLISACIVGLLLGLATYVRASGIVIIFSLFFSIFFLSRLGFLERMRFVFVSTFLSLLLLFPWIDYGSKMNSEFFLATSSIDMNKNSMSFMKKDNSTQLIPYSDETILFEEEYHFSQSAIDSKYSILSRVKFYLEKASEEPYKLIKNISEKAIKVFYMTSSQKYQFQILIMNVILLPAIMFFIYIFLKENKSDEIRTPVQIIIITSIMSFLLATFLLPFFRYVSPYIGLLLPLVLYKRFET